MKQTYSGRPLVTGCSIGHTVKPTLSMITDGTWVELKLKTGQTHFS